MSRAQFAASARMRPRSTPRRRARSLAASRSTRVISLISRVSSSFFLWRWKVYSPRMAPSTMAWAQASGSRPGASAPWVTVAIVSTPRLRRWRTAPATALRSFSKLHSSALPRPRTRTRGEGMRQKVWRRVSSFALPRASPSLTSWEIAPSSLWSTAAVGPVGAVPSYKATIIALAGWLVISPRCTLIFMSGSFGTFFKPAYNKGHPYGKVRHG